ncbi:hypothetical protein THARTR1_09682 [Trichoderma harzianum]|uniref:Uncharacterized protein n=1 Tax=Trichoderma harzianum TaxID=5544 RepID=A0A2K0TV09_TRIHA|nr:hypothetical protein THARTR1_09682 [Trichoderma harzianum]
MKDVQDVTEHVMTCPRDWVTICSQLDELYGDAQQTIDAVTEAIVAWCKAIISLVTDKSGSKWKNEMIRRVDTVGQKIRLEIKIYQEESPSVVWSDNDLGFVLSIPETKKMDMSELVPVFKEQLLSTVAIPFTPNAENTKAPSELLLDPPYDLSIRTSDTCFIVQSNHSRSLEFLAAYLRKNCRCTRTQTFALKNIFKTLRPPAIDIKLKQSPFTPKSKSKSKSKSSAIYDTLVLKVEPSFGDLVNRNFDLLLTHLVEEELGYESQSSDQNGRYYRSMGAHLREL